VPGHLGRRGRQRTERSRAIVIPISRSNYNRLDVRIEPPERGLVAVSHALPDQVRTISRKPLAKRRGRVTDLTLTEVIARVGLLIKSP
jgi:mRNA-degrading endonuclease toxin of MazEF toxin-antitoxin module